MKNKSKTSEEPTVEEVDESVFDTPFERSETTDTTLFIAHKIKDYETWKAAFDLAESVRKKHGLKALNVYKEMTNPDVVLVYAQVTDLEAAREYITSENLQKSMETAGVIGAMDLYWMSHQLKYSQPITDSILMFCSFNVISYDRWEEAFLKDFKEDHEKDFQVRNVMKGVEDPGQIAMMFVVDDPDYVEKTEKDNVFRNKMLAAGVISYPVTYKLVNMPL